MFAKFEDLRDHLVDLMTMDGGPDDESAVAFGKCRTPEQLAEEITDHVATSPVDAMAWLIEAVTKEFYESWGRVPDNL